MQYLSGTPEDMWYRFQRKPPDKVPPFGSRAYVEKFGPLTPDQTVAYVAHFGD